MLGSIRSKNSRNSENAVVLSAATPQLEQDDNTPRRISTLESRTESEDTMLQEMKRGWLNRNLSIGGVKEFIEVYGQRSRVETRAGRRLS
jgi:hypothetical protein